MEGDDYFEGSAAQNDTIAYVTHNAFKLPSLSDTLKLTDFDEGQSSKSNKIDGNFPQNLSFKDEGEKDMISSDSNQQ